MLTPSTRASIRPRTLSTSAIPYTQTRTLFGWKPRLASYDSHLDPLYPRFIRHRTLKTRAKLLKTIRRRQQFDWNAEVKPIVGPKHVRYASHWDGTNRPKWARCSENEEKHGKQEINADAYELSDKEKAWKKQMDAIRKRIEADPYEAVFGKRFEPFWSPLFPQWTKEEIGVSAKEPGKPAERFDGNARSEKSTPAAPSTWIPEQAAKSTGGKQTSKRTEPYTYASSTSWDSQSNRTKKSEWDSVSRKTTSYEYDPVSNRMVPISSFQPAISQQEQTNVPAHVTWKPVVAKARSSTESAITYVDKVDAEMQNPEQVGPTMAGQKAGSPTDSDLSTSKPPPNELDTLTAVDVRASMGKPRHRESIQERIPEAWISDQRALKQQIRDWDNSVTKLKSQVSAIVDEVSATQLGAYLPTTLDRRAEAPKPIEHVKPLQPAVQRMQSKTEPEPVDLDDAAAHESTEPMVKHASVPKDWDEQADILQSDRVMRTRGSQSSTMRWLDDMHARRAEYQKRQAVADTEKSALEFDKTARLEEANAMLQAKVASQKRAMSEHQDRSAHKIQSLRSELETAYKQSSIHADAFRDQIAGLDKELTAAKFNANEVQVKAIKERYSNKVASLQKELERAYVQSSVHADEFTKRIKELEAELVRSTKAASDASNAKPASKESNLKEMQGEGDFCPNVTKFADSDMWYKQPSSSPKSRMLDSAEAEQKAREKALVSEVKSIYETAYGTIDSHHRQPLDAQNATLECALARHDKHAKYAFRNDGLEAELAGKVIFAAGDAIKQEKLAYAYKKDDLESELAQQVELATQQKAEKNYAYKDSGFEPGSPDQNKPNAADETCKKFAQDGLEAELVEQSRSARVSEPSQRFVPDNLEAELKGQIKVEPSTKQSEAFKPDDLEAELVQQSKTADVHNPSQSFVPDNLEAELKIQSEAAASLEQSGRFKPDDLEAVLQKQDNAHSSEQPSKFMPDDLEAELKKQDIALASTEHPTRFRPGALEAELKRLADEEAKYASDEYAAEAAKPNRISKMEKVLAASLGSELDMPLETAESTSGASPSVQWQQDTSTMPKEWRNYEIVHARGDELVMRKVQDARKVAEPTKASVSATKPFETQSAINPIDATRPSNDVRPVTSDYTSPTGYVNLDLADELAAKSRSTDRSPSAIATNGKDHSISAQDPRSIKRQEPVFSGSRRVRQAERRAKWQQDKRESRQERRPMNENRPGLGSVLFAASLMAAAVAYVLGAVVESETEARDKETQSKAVKSEAEAGKTAAKADGGRWRLDDAMWQRK